MNTQRSQIRKGVLIMAANMMVLSAFAQTFVNGGFEYVGNPDTPANWIAGVGDIKLDSLEKYSGKYSARITDGENPMGSYALAFITLPGHIVKNNKIELKAMLKREVADTVKTAIFVQKLMGDGTISPPHFGEWHTGKGDWAETSLSTVAEPPFLGLAAGVITTGQGAVWLDDFEMYVDEESHDYAPRISPLTEHEMAWLKDNTYSIYPEIHTKMDGRIGDFIGDARIVGLGEVTHGSSTITGARIQMIKSLVENKEFKIIALENTTDLNFGPVNRYISEFATNPQEAIQKGYQFPPEMTDLIEWLARYHVLTGKRVRFMGTENLNISNIIAQVDSLQNGELENELKTLRHVILPVFELKQAEDFSHVKPVEFTQEQTDEIMRTLAVCREWAKQNMTDTMDLDLMTHYLELIERYIGLSGDIRDEIMADNIEWIARRYPDEKIIFLAHNDHVGYVENRGLINRAGYYLRQKFGDDYYTVGACFYKGSFKAISGQSFLDSASDNREEYVSQPAMPGSYEYLFNSMSKPDFFLPLRGLAINENNRWIAGPMQFRSIGAVYHDYGFNPTCLPEQFDAVVFIRESKSTRY